MVKAVGRKGTKEWRKNIDISPEEEQLEQERKNEMTGGPVALKADDQLFTIDVTADQKISQKIKKRRRVDEILAERSAVPAIRSKNSNSIATGSSSSSSGRKLSKNTLAQLKKIKKKLDQKESAVDSDSKVKGDELGDIWANDEVVESSGVVNAQDNAFSRKLSDPIQSAKTPAIKHVYPGESYNPSTEDHQKLLMEAYQLELQKINQKENLQDLLPDVNAILRAQKIDSAFTMDIDLGSEDEEEDASADDNDVDSGDTNGDAQPSFRKSGVPIAKTPVQRNKEKRIKQTELQHARNRRLKAIVKAIETIENLQKQVNQTEQERRQLAINKLKLQKFQSLYETKQLSKYNFEPLPIAIKLTEELPGSLRELTPESNPLKERFNRLQQRNIIETRLPVMRKRKYQQKMVETHLYKKFV
ncbi:hypothetical protein MP228_001188 [Amoeboaphelidium protococcarum]|nr:hypothetical protein MP228_001188 [Amoeboaphelidium protococcarum]